MDKEINFELDANKVPRCRKRKNDCKHTGRALCLYPCYGDPCYPQIIVIAEELDKLKEIGKIQKELIDWYEYEFERYSYNDEDVSEDLLEIEKRLRIVRGEH